MVRSNLYGFDLSGMIAATKANVIVGPSSLTNMFATMDACWWVVTSI
jgi:hypothetical protein